MSRRWITLLIVLGALLIVRAAVWLHRSERPVFPTLPKNSPPPPEVPEAPPAPRPEPQAPPAAAARPARRAFDRLLEHIRPSRAHLGHVDAHVADRRLSRGGHGVHHAGLQMDFNAVRVTVRWPCGFLDNRIRQELTCHALNVL